MRTTLLICLASVLCIFAAVCVSGAAKANGWGDIGNGRYQNPIVPGDFSDTDAIRVGDDYYAISSTMQFSPGMVILHSRDLVNWEIIGHAVDDLTKISPTLNWDNMNCYGKGVWAGSIRHYKGRFWIYFGTPDEGFFMTSSVSPAGPWEPLSHVWAAAGWDDCCSFCDDDGQLYLVATRFSRDPADGKSYNIHLFKMTPDGKNLVPESDRIIYQAAGSEANKLYKIDGVYYHFFSEVRPEGRVCMMQRTKDLNGAWEVRQLNHVDANVDREPNQGGLLHVSPDKWMFLTHMGHGDWEGRPLCLLPVTWTDGWPIIGEPGEDKVGRMVWSGEIPVKSTKKLFIATSDDFRLPQLKPQWEWNYQPRADNWSLTERPGWLRLKAFQPIRPEDERDILLRAGNTITQRSYRTPRNSVTVKLDISHMANGQLAGLTHFSTGNWSILGVKQSNDVRSIVFERGNVVTTIGSATSAVIWLRSVWDSDGLAQYYFSVDGHSYVPAGDASHLTWASYRGDRIGLFTYNVLTDLGWVDATNFEYDYASADATHASGPLDFGKALIPDMVADPSIVDIDGAFYCYATTDGWGDGLRTSGTPVVWTSKDFLNWSFEGSSFPPDFDMKYWAPSSLVHRNGRYYSFPTLDGQITAVVADSPLGPFVAPDGSHVTKAHHQVYPIDPATIDAEVFVDDDEQAYMVWQRRHIVKLKPDLLSPDGPTAVIATKRQGYSEGPYLTKRNGIYYYFYTLGGGESYQYAYMMSHVSPMGPWEAPAEDIIATSDPAQKVSGPGHGCFFHPQGSDRWYFAYLEFGRGSTTRQVYVNEMHFNADGTIQPIKLTKLGVGALRPVAEKLVNLAIGCTATASSVRADYKVRPESDPTLDRTETYAPTNAVDDLNGTRWLADTSDKAPWLQVDLGAPRDVKRTEAYFSRPAAGHAYTVECSVDGVQWSKYGGHADVQIRSPHRDSKAVRARYFKLTILQGEPGLWEFRVYGKANATNSDVRPRSR